MDDFMLCMTFRLKLPSFHIKMPLFPHPHPLNDS
jgi:hypothetical protein